MVLVISLTGIVAAPSGDSPLAHSCNGLQGEGEKEQERMRRTGFLFFGSLFSTSPVSDCASVVKTQRKVMSRSWWTDTTLVTCAQQMLRLVAHVARAVRVWKFVIVPRAPSVSGRVFGSVSGCHLRTTRFSDFSGR